MYPTLHLSGQETGSDLMNLRRELIKERRTRRAQAYLLSSQSAPAGALSNIIEFPSPDYPRIA